MRRRRVLGAVGLAVLACGAALAQPARRARGAPCPGAEVRIFKARGTLELWCGGARRQVFPATFGAEPVGPKEREGDERTPEGTYAITSRVVTPRFHRFLGVSYPNAEDRRRAAALGVRRLGGGIGIHGSSARLAPAARVWIRLAQGAGLARAWGPTDGCIGLTNEDVEVVYERVPVGARVVIAP